MSATYIDRITITGLIIAKNLILFIIFFIDLPPTTQIGSCFFSCSYLGLTEVSFLVRTDIIYQSETALTFPTLLFEIIIITGFPFVKH